MNGAEGAARRHADYMLATGQWAVGLTGAEDAPDRRRRERLERLREVEATVIPRFLQALGGRGSEEFSLGELRPSSAEQHGGWVSLKETARGWRIGAGGSNGSTPWVLATTGEMLVLKRIRQRARFPQRDWFGSGWTDCDVLVAPATGDDPYPPDETSPTLRAIAASFGVDLALPDDIEGPTENSLRAAAADLGLEYPQ